MIGNARMRAIRNWLLQQPRPHSVRVTTGDEDHSIEIGHQKWAAVATSIDALEPDKLEALDEKNKLIRACRVEQLEVNEDEADDTPASDKKDAKRAEREQAAIVAAQTEMMREFARLLADAYKHSTSVAFEKLAEICNIFAKRGDSLEKSLAATERLLRRAYDEAALGGDQEGGEPSLLESFMNAFMAGKEQGGAAPSNGARKTNGKGNTQI